VTRKKKGAGGRDGGCRRAQDSVAWEVDRCVQVLGRDEVVGAGREGVGEVVQLPVDELVDAGLGEAIAAIEGSPRYVDGGDVPAPAREPDGIGSLAASEVERRPGREVGSLVDLPPRSALRQTRGADRSGRPRTPLPGSAAACSSVRRPGWRS